jgi:cytochrome c551/c552
LKRHSASRVAQLALGAALAALSVSSPAQDRLIPGPGSELTQARCGTCHEIGYVTRAPQSRAQWEDVMRVMVVERGAPVTPDEVKIITDYLATYYSREGPSAAAQAASAQAAAAQAAADPVTQLLNRNGCVSCHTMDQPLVGPAFRDVAAKYRGDPAAAARLTQKVKAGGQGVWGRVPMPPNPGLSDADAKLLIDWVLVQK